MLQGKIYIIGAGPGDVEYLTIRGQQLLSRAEVLVYDALVDDRLLHLVPTNCQKFNVGKRGGSPSTPQAEINQLLVEQCQQSKQVVRLKSGDPFIFGRSSEEIQALIAAGCLFEVVPGISSALAAPLLAGIPLTDPVLSSCFAILTAHQPEELDWDALARIDTLVILMGGRHLEVIVHQLQRYGRSPQTAIAVIRACGRPQQQVWIGTLGDIVEQTAGVSLSPVVIVVGEVVGLRNYLSLGMLEREFQVQVSNQSQLATQVLKGKTVLVTRSADQSSQFRELLQQEGAEVIEMPTLVITPPSSWDALDHAIANLADFDWLILTSTNGVDYFFERLLVQGKDTRALAGVKIAVVGKKTAASLKQHSLQPDFIPPNFVADSLIEHFPEPLSDKKVLFPRVETGGREVLVKELSDRSARVVEVAAYQSSCPTAISPVVLNALQKRNIDIITFASSKTVQNFYQLLEQALKTDRDSSINSLLEGIGIASIGPQTSKTCHQLFGRVDVEAEEYTLEGLTQAVVKWVTALKMEN
ncbi:MAG TPA: uroporphyrinogen-III C-methyltransferase [Cyanobacteria bacterium UBA8803]|nr:uroporphyrinogen-III C-methyltransferase [Cyanobacteria bacterium UBA9273]HBL58039.1 uroporphyrinogen-III C-methyltransferase [Cyanobacteria bacterium UBA8803]